MSYLSSIISVGSINQEHIKSLGQNKYVKLYIQMCISYKIMAFQT